MKKILNYLFCTLGVIFFVLICAGAYIWFADPFEIRPLISMLTSTDDVSLGADGADVTPAVDKNPVLNSTQEAALEKVGIDPAAVPTSITPAQEACFVSKLGAARVAEIKAGDTPSATEIFTARSCVE